MELKYRCWNEPPFYVRTPQVQKLKRCIVNIGDNYATRREWQS